MAKRKAGMSDADYDAYKARLARRKLEAEAYEDARKQIPAPQEMSVEVGMMTAQVDAGPDEVLGTEDDIVDITPTASLFPEYSSKDTKVVLLMKTRMVRIGVKGLSMKDSKKDILAALDAAKAAL